MYELLFFECFPSESVADYEMLICSVINSVSLFPAHVSLYLYDCHNNRTGNAISSDCREALSWRPDFEVNFLKTDPTNRKLSYQAFEFTKEKCLELKINWDNRPLYVLYSFLSMYGMSLPNTFSSYWQA